jgi:single-strand DNA-binding protein
MSDGLNQVMLLGNLGQDPELKVTQGGKSILKLRLATSSSYLDQGGQRIERTEWHTVTVFEKRAEGLAKILHKGSKLMVSGEIRTSSYEKDGEKRYSTEIIAKDVILCDSKPASAGGTPSIPPPRAGGPTDEAPSGDAMPPGW